MIFTGSKTILGSFLKGFLKRKRHFAPIESILQKGCVYFVGDPKRSTMDVFIESLLPRGSFYNAECIFSLYRAVRRKLCGATGMIRYRGPMVLAIFT